MSHESVIEEWRAAGRITVCPPAFVATTRQARELTPDQRAALQPKPRDQERARAAWNTLGGLTRLKAPTPVADGMPAPVAGPIGNNDIPVAETTRRPMPYLSDSETTVRMFKDGHREVTTIDHQGRWYVARFAPARNGLSNYQGTTFVNRAAFESVGVK